MLIALFRSQTKIEYVINPVRGTERGFVLFHCSYVFVRFKDQRSPTPPSSNCSWCRGACASPLCPIARAFPRLKRLMRTSRSRSSTEAAMSFSDVLLDNMGFENDSEAARTSQSPIRPGCGSRSRQPRDPRLYFGKKNRHSAQLRSHGSPSNERQGEAIVFRANRRTAKGPEIACPRAILRQIRKRDRESCAGSKCERQFRRGNSLLSRRSSTPFSLLTG